MEAIAHDALIAMLDRLKLTAIRDQLDSLLDEAARSEMTLREALGFLVSREIARRDERRIEMATKLAQFPFVRELDGFEWSAQPSLDQRQIRELATCRWIAHGDALLFLGPPGTGKTQVSIAVPGLMPWGSRGSLRLRRSDRGSDPVPGMPGTGSIVPARTGPVRVQRP